MLTGRDSLSKKNHTVLQLLMSSTYYLAVSTQHLGGCPAKSAGSKVQKHSGCSSAIEVLGEKGKPGATRPSVSQYLGSPLKSCVRRKQRAVFFTGLSGCHSAPPEFDLKMH